MDIQKECSIKRYEIIILKGFEAEKNYVDFQITNGSVKSFSTYGKMIKNW